MDDVLRRSVAHVLVTDLEAPEPGDAAIHHVGRVLRVRDGEVVTVTDGRGGWRPCVLAGARLTPDGEVHRTPPVADPVTIAVAVPKGDRADWLVQKCTEVGVDRIVLLQADHSVVRRSGERAARHLERLQRLVVEASMQSRRVRLPELVGPLPARQVLTDIAIAEPGGRPLRSSDRLLAIGPEGGWSASEVSIATGSVSLGSTVLRVETAAVVAAALMVAHRQADS